MHRTVQDAVFAGDTELGIGCDVCRILTVRDLAKLPNVLGNDLIADLHKRLICSRCGTRPKADDVTVKAPLKLPTGQYPRWEVPSLGEGEVKSVEVAPGHRRWKSRHGRPI
jgi:hypothetical protein